MVKEQYEELDFEVVCFANDDVIVASEYEGPVIGGGTTP